MSKTQRQCGKCPWRMDVNPRDIPSGYCVDKHEGLASTIAKPDELGGSRLRMMACHESAVGRERPCVGWLDNQLGVGNNILLRLEVCFGRVSGDYKLVGEQHACFEDTLPQGDSIKED